MLAEYNKSVICFENTLKIQPDFQAAAKRKHAVLCHASLEGALENQHRWDNTLIFVWLPLYALINTYCHLKDGADDRIGGNLTRRTL